MEALQPGVLAKFGLLCSVCKSGYSESSQPTIIQKCQHTFCSKCLDNSSSCNDTIACPECNLVSPKSELKVNEYYLKLLALSDAAKKSPEQQSEDVRRHADNDVYLCACEKHQDVKAVVYCTNHYTTMCLSCMLAEHQTHDIIPIEEARQRYRSTVREKNDQLQERKHELEDILNNIQTKENDYNNKVEKVKREISLLAERIVSRVNQQKTDLMKKLDDISKSNLKTYKAILKELQEKIKEIDQQLALYEQLYQCDSDMSKWRELRDVQLDVQYGPSLDKPVFNVSYAFLANVDLDTLHIGNIYIFSRQTSFNILTSVARCSSLDIPSIQGITTLHSVLYVIKNSSAVIDVYDRKSITPYSKITVQGLKDPVSITSSEHSGCLYIADWYQSEVFCVDNSTAELICKWTTMKQPLRLGLTANNNNYDDIIICCCDDELQIYRNSGQLIKSIKPQNELSVSHAVVIDDDNYIICDCDNNRVCLVNSIGRIQREYNGATTPAAVNGQCSPYCLTTASINNQQRLLIADCYNNRIISSSLSLNDSSELLCHVDGIKQPQLLSFDLYTGRLFVASSYNNTLLVFNLF